MIALQRYYQRRFGKPVPRSLLAALRRDYGPARDHLAERAKLAARVAELAEAGFVALVHGGRDCDGGQWDGHVTTLPANAMSVVRWTELQDRYADGPWWFNLERPSVAADVESTSRDLGLEAFENGHPGVLYT